MPYPFDTSPLEAYLPKLRKLQKDEAVARYALGQCLRDPEESTFWKKELSTLEEQLKAIKSTKILESRNFDIFLSELDNALEVYLHENPVPPKPIACEHRKFERRLKTHRDNSTHIVDQCLNCGSLVRSYKKSHEESFPTLTPFDHHLRSKENIEYYQWWFSRNTIVNQIVDNQGRPPEFNEEAFKKSYKVNYHEPTSPEYCTHESWELRIRLYSNSDAVVKQCNHCGVHIKAVSKKNIPNYFELPHFDSEARDLCYSIHSEWSKRYYAALKTAQKEFKSSISKKIALGEIKIKETSTFELYYSTPEWNRTRDRIFKRDKYKCQACSTKAECIHHIVYDRLGRENDMDLISLCISCHEAVHAYQNKQGFRYKLTPKEIATQAFSL
jgi:hypothetical protein